MLPLLHLPPVRLAVAGARLDGRRVTKGADRLSLILAVVMAPWVLLPYSVLAGAALLTGDGMRLGPALEEVWPFALVAVAIGYAGVLLIGLPVHWLLGRRGGRSLTGYLLVANACVLLPLTAVWVLFGGAGPSGIAADREGKYLLLALVLPTSLVALAGWFVACVWRPGAPEPPPR